MGMGRTHVAWYRCFLPALALKADWIGYGTKPPDIRSVTGFVRGGLQEPNYEDYRIIVVQQPRGRQWLEWMADLHAKGIKVVIEIDDDLKAVAHMKTHGNRKQIHSHLFDYEQCMRFADGIIASTEVLANRLKRFNKNVWVCEAGIDMERYQLERPPHDEFTIGFAGGLGHEVSLEPWIPAINSMIGDGVRFISVGMDYTHLIDTSKGGEAISIPFTQVEAWPSVLSNFDVLLAPGGNNGFFKAKSELKWIEASAMGIPVIASPVPYRSIKHMDTGWSAETAEQVRSWLLSAVYQRELASEMAERARTEVQDSYHIKNRAEAWISVFEALS